MLKIRSLVFNEELIQMKQILDASDFARDTIFYPFLSHEISYSAIMPTPTACHSHHI